MPGRDLPELCGTGAEAADRQLGHIATSIPERAHYRNASMDVYPLIVRGERCARF